MSGIGGERPAVVSDQAALAGALAPGDHTVVMTMGALHQGHLDLVEAGRRLGGQLVVTIFVNPLQFGAGEDYEVYPRTLAADLDALTGRGVDLVYAPSAGDMYPAGEPLVRLQAGPIGHRFEGAARPGHFDGMLTVVAKLALRTRAKWAVFGQKDAQQLALIRQMNQDLDLGLELVAVPTRREADGLALSSRNRYLTAAERTVALELPQALMAGKAAAEAGATAGEVRRLARQRLAQTSSLELPDYLELVDSVTFEPLPEDHRGPGLLIGALRVGQTRLIDNQAVILAG
ncbi:MAG: pantoate--beta-alanine ligase [Bifidobacteriaceae bacterium]|jgi:pantoate--beta-alanine ligase|nr:pantoate--beta-alanine ligase [Bifidobacteriaceae bacterium]